MIMGYLRRLWQHFLDDSLFRNSVYLMLTTAVSGGLGFFFWLICTHLFSPDQIGVGTTLISTMGLISVISLLGFNSTFVRVLPDSKNRNNEINTGSLLVIGAAMIMGMAYVLMVPYIAPPLEIISINFWYAAGFVVMVGLASINALTDSIFIAYRAAQYALMTDGVIMGGVKLFLPLVFFGLGAYGVFTAAGAAASAGMIASVLYLVLKFDYHPQLKIDVPTLKSVFNYSFNNYIAALLNIAPTLLLPIIVINHLGATAAGYFYLAFMVINLLYTVSNSVSQSLFAEGSYSDSRLRDLFKRSALLLIVIMIPAAFVLALFGPFVLDFFGKTYSAGGSSVIVMLAIAAPAVAAFALGGTLLKITRQIYSLVVINLVYAAIIIVLALHWINRGLVWVAIAWLIGNLVAAALSFLAVLYNHWRHLKINSLA